MREDQRTLEQLKTKVAMPRKSQRKNQKDKPMGGTRGNESRRQATKGTPKEHRRKTKAKPKDGKMKTKESQRKAS